MLEVERGETGEMAISEVSYTHATTLKLDRQHVQGKFLFVGDT